MAKVQVTNIQHEVAAIELLWRHVDFVPPGLWRTKRLLLNAVNHLGELLDDYLLSQKLQ